MILYSIITNYKYQYKINMNKFERIDFMVNTT